MKKADLIVGEEYAISGDLHVVGPEGLTAMRDFGSPKETFPLGAVRKMRVEEIDVPVEVKHGFRGEYTKTEKMVRVTWLPTGIERLDGFMRHRGAQALGRFVHHADTRYLKHVRNVLAPWEEFETEYHKRIAAKQEREIQNGAAEALRARVLRELEERGISAREGGGYQYIEIEASELERLMGMVSTDAVIAATQVADSLIRDAKGR